MEPLVFKLDMIQTLALAAVSLFTGDAIRRRTAFLDNFNIPAAVVGGFLFAAAVLALRLAGWVVFQFDTALQAPLMIAFFTTIGFGANLKLLKNRRTSGAAVLNSRNGPGHRSGRRRSAFDQSAGRSPVSWIDRRLDHDDQWARNGSRIRQADGRSACFFPGPSLSQWLLQRSASSLAVS